MLWALADKGREKLPTLLKNLSLKFPTESPNTILETAERDIAALERQGLLYLIWQSGSEEQPVLATERESIVFTGRLRWNETGNQWEVQPREPAFTDLISQLTQGGAEALDLIAAQSSEPTPIRRSKEES